MDLLFKRAFAEIIILELLARRDMYRRQIPAEIQKKTHSLIIIQDSTVFTVTEHLRLRGFITTAYRGTGKFLLHLEETGRQYLQKAWAAYDKLVRGMNAFHP